MHVKLPNCFGLHSTERPLYGMAGSVGLVCSFHCRVSSEVQQFCMVLRATVLYVHQLQDALYRSVVSRELADIVRSTKLLPSPRSLQLGTVNACREQLLCR